MTSDLAASDIHCDQSTIDQSTTTRLGGLSVEGVANVVAGIPAIGVALRALEAAGWHATIAGNRITVDEEVLVQFVAPTVGRFGRIGATWMIRPVADASQTLIVGTGLDCTADLDTA
jgi:hypothetical protein